VAAVRCRLLDKAQFAQRIKTCLFKSDLAQAGFLTHRHQRVQRGECGGKNLFFLPRCSRKGAERLGDILVRERF